MLWISYIKGKNRVVVFLSSHIFAKNICFPPTNFLRVCCYRDDCLRERMRSYRRWTFKEQNTYFMSLFLTEQALVFTPLLMKSLWKKGRYFECCTMMVFAFTKMLLQRFLCLIHFLHGGWVLVIFEATFLLLSLDSFFFFSSLIFWLAF